MKLYYAPGACSLADHIALQESGLAFDIEKVDLRAKRTETGADYYEINPKGYVPALGLDNGEMLTENIAILSFIAHQANSLVPQSEWDRFRVLEELAYISSELHKGYKPFFVPNSSDEDKEAARAGLTKRLALLDQQLSDRDFLVGGRFTVADCYLFVMLRWAKPIAGLDLSPNLSAYMDRISGRAAVREALEAEGIS